MMKSCHVVHPACLTGGNGCVCADERRRVAALGLSAPLEIVVERPRKGKR